MKTDHINQDQTISRAPSHLSSAVRSNFVGMTTTLNSKSPLRCSLFSSAGTFAFWSLKREGGTRNGHEASTSSKRISGL